MAISIFPSTAAEFVSNNFVIDMNDTSNNTADTGGVKQAGPYSISFSSGDSSFDVYLIDEDGNSVGYSNNTSIVASGLFSTVVILGVAQDEVVSFLYQGSVNNADGEGDEPGAGAYLESISPSDLPSIDDTATVTGGNFGADTEITFESGATVLPAKSITVSSSTELLVTRPDGLVEDDAPYTVRAVTTGVPEPTGTNANLLVDEVTAGSDPTWVTTSPLDFAVTDEAFSQTLEATDSEGTVVDYSVTVGSLPTGLSLDASTGVLSGTPTVSGSYTFTLTATDDGGNETPKQFEQSVGLATGGTVTQDNNFIYHTFTSTDDFEVKTTTLDVEYIAIAGGGGGGALASNFDRSSGGGGAGGLLSGTETGLAGITTITIGAGGAAGQGFTAAGQGSDSTFGSLGTAVGGGLGANADSGGGAGGSGGGGSGGGGGAGTAGQGFAGAGTPDRAHGGGGGGASEVGGNPDSVGGDGQQLTDYALASGINVDGGYFAGGGGGGRRGTPPAGDVDGGLGGGGNGAVAGISLESSPGVANTGGGGGGASREGATALASAGGSGVVIVRYAI